MIPWSSEFLLSQKFVSSGLQYELVHPVCSILKQSNQQTLYQYLIPTHNHSPSPLIYYLNIK